MANLAGGAIVSSLYADGAFIDRAGVNETPATFGVIGFRGRATGVPILAIPSFTYYYKMRAQDSGAPSPGYVTWVAQDTPDFAGAGYSGASPTPTGSMVVGSVVVSDEWQV